MRFYAIFKSSAKQPSESQMKFRQEHEQVPWRRMTGFHDVIVHDYADVILEEVWLTIERDLPALKHTLSNFSNRCSAEL